ncbi:unnamed protein product [Prunus armeniaca]|uniref:Ubiquitin-like protease family profile domain-containing protein n=1 Tax=Prunus armeniaca TaxID=36596 RepID=A0A6J5VCE5_PRUAR|nr:unnamed protein product [Prunus armeniaca]
MKISGNTISWNIVSCCQDVRTISKYNWAKATSDFLERQLVKDCEKPSSISGCVAALPFWFCEKIGFIEPLKDRMDVPPKFVKWDVQDLQSSRCNIDISSMTPVIASIGNKKDQVLEEVCGVTGTGCLMSSHVINAKEVVEEVFGEPSDGCLTYKSPSGVPQVGNESNIASKKNLRSTHVINGVGDKKHWMWASRVPHNPKKSGPNIEGRQEFLVSEENSLMKEEIKKLKLRLEEAQVQAVLYNELCVNAEVGMADARKQCNDLSNDLQQLLDRIEQEKGFQNNESSPQLKSWLIRLKHKHKRPKRLPGYVYEGIKTLREPKKAKAEAEKHGVVKQQELWSSDELKGTVQKIKTNFIVSSFALIMGEVPLWQGSCSAIYKDDLMDLLTKAAITCNVIDSFGETLQTEIINYASLKHKSLVMTTHCWNVSYNQELTCEFLQKGDDNNIRLLLHDPLLEALAGADYVFFPMRHENQFHFTLLVLHKADEQWFHYDPRRLVSNSSNDPCFLNAQKLRDAVTSFLQFNSCIAPVVLSNGHRIRQPEKVGEKAIKSSLTNGEKQTFQWLKATDVNYPLWRSTNCPQQMDDSVDCGVTVMYYISTISKCQNMAPCFTENTMKEYRAKVINKFLHDGKSWKDE